MKGASQIPMIMGVVALLLGGAALGVALTNGGHTGATGAAGANGSPGTSGNPGAQGPPGPGALVNQTLDQNTSDELTGACGMYTNSTVNFTVTGPGTLVVSASVEFELAHTLGNYTYAYASLWLATTTCTLIGNNYEQSYVGATEPTGTTFPDLSLLQTFAIPAAGTYPIAIIGFMVTTGSILNDNVYYYTASIAGEFYPS